VKKNIFYYTQIYYLDFALEYIKLASKDFKINLYIELSPEALQANIFNLSINLNSYPTLIDYNDVKFDWGINSLDSYLENCYVIRFVVHPHKRSLSLNSLFISIRILKILKNSNFDYIQMEDISLRTIGFLPYMFSHRNKIILNIHDPKAHSGEFSYKKALLKLLYYRVSHKFICFSDFSKNILNKKHINKQIYLIKLLPYSYYKNFVNPNNKILKNKISFVGRISKYKGVDLFIDAINLLKIKFPYQEYQIAGKLSNGYELNFNNIDLDKVKIFNHYLSNNQLVQIIQSSKIIVCPYKDATQSGVIMTSYALNCPVIVTPTGGLPEYVINNVTGIITKQISAQAIADAIIQILEFELSGNEEDYLMNDFKELNTKQMNLIYI
jgi:glycosyltransferase involved in cell wall biosynthesis